MNYRSMAFQYFALCKLTHQERINIAQSLAYAIMENGGIQTDHRRGLKFLIGCHCLSRLNVKTNLKTEI